MYLQNTTGQEFKKRYTIGEAAKLNHVTPRSLYHYQNKNLLAPAYVGANNYRQYTNLQFLLLDIIKRYKRCGVPLGQLAKMISTDDATYAQSLLQVEIENIQKQIERLMSVKKDIEFFKYFYDVMPDVQQNKDIKLCRHTLNHVFAVPIAAGATPDEADYTWRNVMHSPLFYPVKFFLPFAYMLEPAAFLSGKLLKTHRTSYLIEALPFAHTGYMCIEDCDCLTITLGHGYDEGQLAKLQNFLNAHNLTPRYIFCEEYYDSITNFEKPLLCVKAIL